MEFRTVKLEVRKLYEVYNMPKEWLDDAVFHGADIVEETVNQEINFDQDCDTPYLHEVK